MASNTASHTLDIELLPASPSAVRSRRVQLHRESSSEKSHVYAKSTSGAPALFIQPAGESSVDADHAGDDDDDLFSQLDSIVTTFRNRTAGTIAQVSQSSPEAEKPPKAAHDSVVLDESPSRSPPISAASKIYTSAELDALLYDDEWGDLLDTAGEKNAPRELFDVSTLTQLLASSDTDDHEIQITSVQPAKLSPPTSPVPFLATLSDTALRWFDFLEMPGCPSECMECSACVSYLSRSRGTVFPIESVQSQYMCPAECMECSLCLSSVGADYNCRTWPWGGEPAYDLAV